MEEFMKLLSIAIPCYNSQDYMKKCVESLLPGGDEVEIIIVNDGSKDETAAIAEQYATKYPGIVKVVHQENGGHGEAVNAGLRNATGLYFKVVDSDDWVDLYAYQEILENLKELVQSGELVDLFLANFVYEKEGKKHKKVMHYRRTFPKKQVFTWEDMRFLLKGQYILMHSVIYRTKLLRDCALKLPKHTFYVDNIFVYHPLPYVKNLEIIMVISSIIAIRSGTEENLEKKYQLWQYLKKKDRKLYYELKWGVLGRTMNLPGKTGRKVSVAAYKLANQFVGFN